MMENTKTFIGVPSHNGQIHGDITNAIVDAAVESSNNKGQIAYAHRSFSLLTQNFNSLICQAINSGQWTHFVLLHSDVVPMRGWLGKMHKIMKEMRADILSAIMPIKDDRGVTSTALCYPDDEDSIPLKVKRLTMKEVFNMPETFTDRNLVLNTGLMMIRLDQAFVTEIFFDIKNAFTKSKDGKLVASCVPEDWLYSIQAKRKGAKLFATRGVQVKHVGGGVFPNDKPFGIDKE